MTPAAATATALRDQQVRALIADGHTLRSIAGKLGRSPTHIARIVRALGLRVAKARAKKAGSIGYSLERARGDRRTVRP